MVSISWAAAQHTDGDKWQIHHVLSHMYWLSKFVSVSQNSSIARLGVKCVAQF